MDGVVLKGSAAAYILQNIFHAMPFLMTSLSPTLIWLLKAKSLDMTFQSIPLNRKCHIPQQKVSPNAGLNRKEAVKK